MYNQGLRICNTQTIHLPINIMTTTCITSQMWLATAWQDDYQHRIMFADYNKALQCVWRWEDDCLDDIELELVNIMGDDDLPF